MTTSSRTRRCELLASAPADDLVSLADRVLSTGVEPVVVAAPETGIVVLQVREPVAAERFHLGEVLATTAEVTVGEHRGWAARLGDDREATLAAALLDAVAESGGPLAQEVDSLCLALEMGATERAIEEWRELAPTEVRFEELDQ